MIIIRKSKPEEWPLIVGFQLLMAEETEGIQLDKNELTKGVLSVFEQPEKGCYFFATLNNTVVGMLMITYEWSDWRNKTIFWIQSVYIDRAYRRKGVYSKLYQHIRQLAAHDPQVGGIRLYVDKTNLLAKATYTQLGMNGQHYQVFEWMK